MILVTGGTGLLGSHLLFELTRSGKPVRALKRNSSNTAIVKKIFSYYTQEADFLFKKIEWFDADLLDFSTIEEALDGITEVYHCGAVVSFFSKDYARMLKVNIEGTANLVNLCLENNINRFLYVSSIATLGRADNEGLTTEETYWKTAPGNTRYSVSKYGGEREVWRGMEEGLQALIVNPSVILGPGFWHANSGLFQMVFKGLRYYPGGINGFVDVRDVATIMVNLMERNISRERFIINSENVSYLQLFSYIAGYLKKPAPTIYVSPSLSRVAWRLEMLRSRLTRSTPKLTRDMALTSSRKYAYSNEKIRKSIGYDFIPVEKSVAGICEKFLGDILIGIRQ
ncbi:MAG: NAD-dependent epimerase/dehydratase family protein [Bacteroidetes bacterium]|nr:NAD-dependent epimerase/dehydratase family protein [Bacteroidota bacterium]